MTARFIRAAGEAFDGDYVDLPCLECRELHCDCDDAYRDPEGLRRWMALTADEREARLAEAHAKIAAAFGLSERVESDLRFTIKMQRRVA